MASPSDAATTLRFRVERTEYAEIEVDVAGLLKEWGDTDDPDPYRHVQDVLWQIGVRDLMYSGDFIKVIDTDTEETIRIV